MKRRDEGKTSLVEFLRSIKVSHGGNIMERTECPTHFAHFEQRVHSGQQHCSEDYQLIRSAN